MSPSAPEFSVIIPTYNRLPALRRCLDALARLDYPRERFEVIVVDDGSTAPVADAVLAPELDLTVRRFPNAGPARARNLGAECARGRYLAFTDDDCTPTPTWLRALENGATAFPDAALGGRTINALPDNLCSALSQLVVDVAYACYNSDPRHARFFASNNLAVPADRFRDVGGFDPGFRTAEDRDLCERWLQSGQRLVYVPDAVICHAHSLTLRGLWRQHFHYGRGAYRFHRRHPHWRRFDLDRRFYIALMSRPCAKAHPRRSALLMFLLAVQQMANAGGYFAEMLGSPRGRGLETGSSEAPSDSRDVTRA
jgi:GT2 family glycosyltransferase